LVLGFAAFDGNSPLSPRRSILSRIAAVRTSSAKIRSSQWCGLASFPSSQARSLLDSIFRRLLRIS
jgi:hypothetical protein